MTTFRIKIEHDDHPESPRELYNLGTMVCWHKRYKLGDEQPRGDEHEYLLALAEKVKPGTAQRWERWVEKYPYPRDRQEWKDFEYDRDKHWSKLVQPILDKHIIELPLFLYDHSGVTMSTGRFSCPWDSGKVGFIYVTVAKAKAIYGWKTKAEFNREKIEQTLRHEVQTYDDFLTGQVYGYEVEGWNGEDWEQVDSCYGFYSYEDAPACMADLLDSEYGISLEVIEHAMRSIGEWTTTETGARR